MPVISSTISLPALYKAALLKQESGEHKAAEVLCRHILAQDSDHAEGMHLLAIISMQLRNSQEAERLMRKLLRKFPQEAAYYFTLGQIFQARGELMNAAEQYTKATTLEDQSGDAFYSLGMVLIFQKKNEAAEKYLRKASVLQPENADVWQSFGVCLRLLRRHHEAENALRRAITLRPNDPTAHYHLGVTLHKEGQIESALETYRHALKLKPDYMEAWLSLAHLLTEIGDLDEAQEALKILLMLNPYHAEARRSLADLTVYTTQDTKEIDKLKALLANPQLLDDDKLRCHFSLGKIYDDIDHYDEAMQHFNEGNALQRKCHKFDAAAFQLILDQRKTFFDAAFFKTHNTLGSPDERPVFIVGMPRSGTSLTEQIMASHPDIFGAGEVAYFPLLVQSLAARTRSNKEYPFCVSDMTPTHAQQITAEYLRDISKNAGNAIRITDKMPSNALRLGLLALLFPNARVIYCQRDPRDACLSTYFQPFVNGNEYASDLSAIVTYYTGLTTMMDHWKRVLPLAMMEVKYEALVQDQEAESRKIIEFCGLPWDERCLTFHKTRRRVGTASNWQVRQPIYTSSVGRWKHYAPWLQTLFDALPER